MNDLLRDIAIILQEDNHVDDVYMQIEEAAVGLSPVGVYVEPDYSQSVYESSSGGSSGWDEHYDVCGDIVPFTLQSNVLVTHTCQQQYINVIVVDTDDYIVRASIKYLNATQFRVEMEGQYSGKIIYNSISHG